MNDRIDVEVLRTDLTDEDLDIVMGASAASGADALRDAASGPFVLPDQLVHGYLQTVVYRP
jgi:hypothetical protein